ncbi:MAG: helix-turn-helix domain-containing protein [Ruminococcaceae bacterium]|nr:helix-turn-helix domain-containing protein [Oscillospiraceae bacterium]
MIKLGEKIRSLRKEKNISQEVFAEHLGVSFQAVSKWENGNTMPDVTMIPAIASFFGVSTDELFDFNVYETEKAVEAIVDEYSKHWNSDKLRAEQVIREGLKKYPGNDTLLEVLADICSVQGKYDEVIRLTKGIVERTKYDDLRFDAYRNMAEAYKAKGEYQAAKDAIEHIPEIYFTKLEVAAHLLEGEEMYKAAQIQKNLSADSLIDMLIISGKYLKEQGETEKAASQFKIAGDVMEAFSRDFLETKYFKATLYECFAEQRKEVATLLSE